MFNENENDFLVTEQEGKLSRKNLTKWLLYGSLGALVLVTAAHAIMLVLAQAPTYGSGNGLLSAFLGVVRVAFPVIVEVCAIVAALGFMSSEWRKNQKWIAGGVEVTWLIFAAANMITFFRLERGLPLENWMQSWVDYGLPISALIAGAFTYFLTHADPVHKRQDEATAVSEKIEMTRFSAFRDVMISPQMKAIEKQKAWLAVIQNMRTAGYSDTQIRFLLQDTPKLLVDADQNGQPDLLESGATPTPQDDGYTPYTIKFTNREGKPWSVRFNGEDRQGAKDYARRLAAEGNTEIELWQDDLHLWSPPVNAAPTPNESRPYGRNRERRRLTIPKRANGQRPT